MLMVVLMASNVSATSIPCSSSSSSISKRISASGSLTSAISYPRNSHNSISLCNFPLGLGIFSPWSGLKHLGISNKAKFLGIERRKRISKGKAVFASLFGVGAPEALVIGVVALLVFGPKGLAEVARNLGKTLRTFQPTIRELQDVSREFKSTLEREIGLDEISGSIDSSYNSIRPNTFSNSLSPSAPKAEPTDGSPTANVEYTSEEHLKVTQEQVKASAIQEQQIQTNLAADSQLDSQLEPQGSVVDEPATGSQSFETSSNNGESVSSVPGPQNPES